MEGKIISILKCLATKNIAINFFNYNIISDQKSNETYENLISK